MDQTFVSALIHRNPVIPLLRLQRLGDALPLVEALQEGGMQAVEVWLPHRGAVDVLKTLQEHCTDITIGVGGVRTAAEAKLARQLGAHYVTTPGLSPTVIQACAKLKLPCVPGVATTGELLLARELGMRLLMLYPAAQPGQRALAAAWHELDPELAFIAQSTVSHTEAAQWLDLPNIAGVHAQWLDSDEDLQRRQWRNITEKARRASTMRGLGQSVRSISGSSEAA